MTWNHAGLRREVLQEFVDAARFRGASEPAESAADARARNVEVREEAAERFRAQREADEARAERCRRQAKFIRYGSGGAA